MSPKVLYSCIHVHTEKNWHCNPNTSLIPPQEEFFHKGISSVSLEGNIILSENMLSNKVARILLFWFKSASGCADTVSAACEPPLVYTHVLDEAPKMDLAASDCCRVNSRLHATLDCRFWQMEHKARSGQGGIRSEVLHVFYWTRTLQQI